MNTKYICNILFSAVAVLLLFCVVPANMCCAQPQVIDKDVPVNGLIASQPNVRFFDHSLFNSLLNKHVKEGNVDYQGFILDSGVLDNYLTLLGTASVIHFSREEKLAFYINAYNAFTIKLIIQNWGKIKSIKEINKPWEKKAWFVAGSLLSLNDIEHTILRGQLQEPRIHFAIVCASIGCPQLSSRAYTAKNIDLELDDAAKRFMQSSKYVRLEGSKLYLSKIFQWFSSDFERNQGSVTKFVTNYVTEEMRAKILSKKVMIRYLDYDWNLNSK